jgi:response regulator RpfG family c-di-GMP phosphodiesterase
MLQTNDHRVSALLIGEFQTDRLLVHDIFRLNSWRLFEARDRKHSLECLGKNAVQVVIAESDLPAWNWKRILSDLRRLAPAPQLVVTSRTADDYLWAEVLNVGGYDVLPQPLEREEVERVVASAHRHYDTQRRRTAPAAIISAAAFIA